MVATRCSEYARELGEPLAGTAPLARAWLVVEQPGPWGREALRQSHLPYQIGDALANRSADLPVTVVAARRVGHHADHHVVPAPRNVWAAWTGGATGRGAWLEHGVVDEAEALLDLDLAALAEGRSPGLGPHALDELVLVCTNARRDRCCALEGRPTARRLAARPGAVVWECSHLGGHRFAPTVLSLPLGYVFGGPDAERMTLGACRGRSALERPAQAAELAVLRARDAATPSPLDVRAAGTGRWLVDRAAHAEPVDVHEEVLPPPRPESCGKDDVLPTTMVATLAGAAGRTTGISVGG